MVCLAHVFNDLVLEDGITGAKDIRVACDGRLQDGIAVGIGDHGRNRLGRVYEWPRWKVAMFRFRWKWSFAPPLTSDHRQERRWLVQRVARYPAS